MVRVDRVMVRIADAAGAVRAECSSTDCFHRPVGGVGIPGLLLWTSLWPTRPGRKVAPDPLHSAATRSRNVRTGLVEIGPPIPCDARSRPPPRDAGRPENDGPSRTAVRVVGDDTGACTGPEDHPRPAVRGERIPVGRWRADSVAQEPHRGRRTAGAVTSTTAPLIPGIVDQRYAVISEAPRPPRGASAPDRPAPGPTPSSAHGAGPDMRRSPP